MALPEKLNIENLAKADEALKGGTFNDEARELLQYYDDTSRTSTSAMLSNLCLGVKNNPYPLEVSILRKIIDRIAVVYQRAPTRRLTRDDKLIAEDDPSNIQMKFLLKESNQAKNIKRFRVYSHPFVHNLLWKYRRARNFFSQRGQDLYIRP